MDGGLLQGCSGATRTDSALVVALAGSPFCRRCGTRRFADVLGWRTNRPRHRRPGRRGSDARGAADADASRRPRLSRHRPQDHRRRQRAPPAYGIGRERGRAACAFTRTRRPERGGGRPGAARVSGGWRLAGQSGIGRDPSTRLASWTRRHRRGTDAGAGTADGKQRSGGEGGGRHAQRQRWRTHGMGGGDDVRGRTHPAPQRYCRPARHHHGERHALLLPDGRRRPRAPFAVVAGGRLHGAVSIPGR